MSNTIQTYTGLITSEHQSKPNFIAVITAATAPLVQIQTLLQAMIDLFDLDMNPVGDQLDIIGQWVGISRLINNPFSNIFFTWDGVQSNGWDFGIWQSATHPTAIVSLPDDIYLSLINAKIAANSWDGTTEGAYKIWDVLFPQFSLIIDDHQNMSFSVALQGGVPDSLTLALLVGGYLPLRPEGVEISEYFIPVDSNPLFAWDSDSSYVNGWDVGSWAIEMAPT
jgi:hypothetical protein